MNEAVNSGGVARSLARSELPLILIAAVVQAAGLYGLHLSIERGVWPATSPGWLVALYAVAVLSPLTVQMLAPHSRRPLMWASVAAFAAFYLLVGWHYGAWVLERPPNRPVDGGIELVVVLPLQWLLALPFLQARLVGGRWRSRYELFFSTAWNNKLLLGEAAAFTGLFWLLLLLWAQLFDMLGISFFATFFQKPIFVYSATSIVFGVALNLIGSLERFRSVVLEQILSVLKWLALLAGLILALFTVALVAKLPGMIASGQRTISAAWLLWLVAVIVLLFNAAYRDGSIENPYPRAIAFVLRCVVPLTAVVALVAIYALWVRVDRYGFTASRFWACVVAGAAFLYSVGYAVAARYGTHWMKSIATVNVGVAMYLIATVTLALTPVLSPYRIAADSQFAKAVEVPSGSKDTPGSSRSTHLAYLRFDAGKYGRDRLEELSRIENHPRAEDIRREAKAALARQTPWDVSQVDGAKLFADIVLQPPGRTLEPALAELAKHETPVVGPSVAGIFVDLDNDQIEEFVLLHDGVATLYRKDGGTWRFFGRMTGTRAQNPDSAVESVRDGDFQVVPPSWNDLVIGGVRYGGLNPRDSAPAH